MSSSSETTTTTTTTSRYWNREAFASSSSPSSFEEQAPVREARIVSLSFPGDPNNAPLESETSSQLPPGARLLQVGGTLADLDLEALRKEQANVAFVSPGVTRETLAGLIEGIPSLEWIHCRSAGIDVLTSETLSNSPDELVMTNAKGAFSSTLAEYTMLAISYFAKDLPRLLRNKREGNWEKYSVLEIRGATLGIVGYGDIGRAAARLAKAYGMRVVALRRNVPAPEAIAADPLCDAVYGDGSENLNRLFGESDYVLCSLPLTEATHKMIGKDQFDHAKKEGCVFINVGRGPIVDEEALVEALKDGRLKGAGLDVFTKEPLDEDSELWNLDNVLLSPHNMDQTATFMLESTQFFVNENLPRFICGQALLNPVDKKAGY
ncbi:unnamed protein product [Pseudo-nitzschia multistriata]|uniref:D-isomer specific 2-hydroxyacid dehydrogenase NAD-binding domain-containing protein n=1 Tax=Pseudo-nitzschia multistriata TaxID=183589 RepID=A0A448YUZ2_9STRA|nr:unnamed protein product [Pseudo-nitzschia multistriata]